MREASFGTASFDVPSKPEALFANVSLPSDAYRLSTEIPPCR